MAKRTTRGTQFFHTDTAKAEIRWDGSQATLYLDGVESSAINVNDPTFLEFEYMQHMTCALNSLHAPDEPVRALHLGGAACALATAWDAMHPNSRQSAVEIDAALAQAVREYFPIPRSPKLRIRVADARKVLSTSRPASFDVIVRDVFLHGIVPDHLRTHECVQEAHDALRPGGLYLVNCAHGGTANAREDVAAIRGIFPRVASIQDPKVGRSGRRGNVVIIAQKAGDRPVDWDDIDRQLRTLPLPARLKRDEELTRWIAGCHPLRDADIGWDQDSTSSSALSSDERSS